VDCEPEPPERGSRGRILCVTSNFPRWTGDSTTPFVLHLAQDLQALGWRVDVLAPHAPGCANRETIDGVDVARFRYLWPAAAQTVCYGGGALINLRKRPSNYAKLPALVAAEWFAVARRLATGRYDLLHAHWLLPQGLVAALTARPLRIPQVTTVHGSDAFGLQGPALTWFKRRALHGADAVTVNSSVTERAIRDIAGDARSLHRIPMGVDTGAAADPALVDRIRRTYRRGRGPLLMFLGRLVKEKGVQDLIQAVRLLVPELPDVTCVLLGEGQDRAAAEKLVSELGLADRVTLAGWLPPAEVPSYLAAADALVAPTRMEAQGLSIIEAMAAGTPVIASRVGGVVDAVQDGETGILVPERSPEAIAAAVTRLVHDPLAATAMAGRAAQMARQRFSRGASAAAFTEVFEGLLAGGRRTGPFSRSAGRSSSPGSGSPSRG
jgi:phosphatidyl-myo-inositol dimannoside synthase